MKIKYLLFLLAFVTQHAYSNTIYIESMPIGASTYTSGGWVLDGVSFIGIRFEVTEDVHITGLLGNLGGNGNFFGAIDNIEPGDTFPSVSTGFNSAEVLAYATSPFLGSISSDTTLPLDLVLSAGTYAAFFGGFGSFGGSDYGWMPGAQNVDSSFFPIGSEIPLNDYLEYSANSVGWTEFPRSGARIALLTDTAAVPVPATIWLILSGFGALIMCARNRKH